MPLCSVGSQPAGTIPTTLTFITHLFIYWKYSRGLYFFCTFSKLDFLLLSFRWLFPFLCLRNELTVEQTVSSYPGVQSSDTAAPCGGERHSREWSYNHWPLLWAWKRCRVWMLYWLGHLWYYGISGGFTATDARLDMFWKCFLFIVYKMLLGWEQ